MERSLAEEMAFELGLKERVLFIMIIIIQHLLRTEVPCPIPSKLTYLLFKTAPYGRYYLNFIDEDLRLGEVN